MSKISGRSQRGFLAALFAFGLVAALIATHFSTSVAQETQVPATPVALGPTVPPELTDYANDWPTAQGNLSATRASASSTIDTSTISQLGTAWKLPISATGTYGAVTSNPLVLGDTIYLIDMQSNIWAIDKATGAVKWSKEYNVSTVGPNGLAVGYGMVVGVLGDSAEVVALKADTGEEIWTTKLSANMGEGVDMAPLIYDNTVYVSTVPGNTNVFYRGGQKGIFYALDASSGQVIWQWDTTTDNLWGNARVNSGGGLWYPPSIDDQGNIYFGVGNSAPYPGNTEFPAGSSRPGDNDYASSMVSLDPTTGSLRWYINTKPHDLFDLDFQNTPILATVNINGTDTKIAIGTGKNGLVVAANADTGQELWRTPVGTHSNDDLQELPADSFVEVYPGTLGGVETPPAYANGIVFVPLLNLATRYNGSSLDPTSIDLTKATGELVAIDAATGKILWDAKQPTMTLGGATVANDVVFTGGLDGVVRGYNVKDGTQVFTYQASAGLNAPFAVAGDMLLVPAGGPLIPSSDTSSPAPTAASELIAFKIGAPVEAAPAAATPATTEPAAATPAATGGNTVELDMVDIAFTQKELTIPANTDVTLHVVNQGAAVHNFTIDNPAITSGDVQPGASTDVTLNLPPGTYQYYCSIPGHREAGMVGTLTVQ